MSETYAYHITTTGIWNALKKYKELAGESYVAGTMDTCTAACAAGTWDNINVCTACVLAAGDATVTCTDAGSSVVVTCKDGFYTSDTDVVPSCN